MLILLLIFSALVVSKTDAVSIQTKCVVDPRQCLAQEMAHFIEQLDNKLKIDANAVFQCHLLEPRNFTTSSNCLTCETLLFKCEVLIIEKFYHHTDCVLYCRKTPTNIPDPNSLFINGTVPQRFSITKAQQSSQNKQNLQNPHEGTSTGAVHWLIGGVIFLIFFLIVIMAVCYCIKT